MMKLWQMLPPPPRLKPTDELQDYAMELERGACAAVGSVDVILAPSLTFMLSFKSKPSNTHPGDAQLHYYFIVTQNYHKYLILTNTAANTGSVAFARDTVM